MNGVRIIDALSIVEQWEDTHALAKGEDRNLGEVVREVSKALVQNADRDQCLEKEQDKEGIESETTRYHSLAFGGLVSADPGECPYCGEGSIEEER